MLKLSTVRVLVATPLRGRAYDGSLERGSHGLSFGLSFSQRAKAVSALVIVHGAPANA